MLRFRTLLIFCAAIAVAFWLSQRTDSQHVAASGSTDASPSTIAPTTAPAGDRVALPAAEPRAQTTQPLSPDRAGTASNGATARNAPLRLDVHAPSSAHVGERVSVTVDAEAFDGIRDLSFVVVYDGGLLELVSSAPGSFVRQASAPATLSAEDPSTGNALVHMDIKNGGVVAAAGTVVVLEFNALHAGTSPITLRDVSFLESGRSSSSMASSDPTTSIVIE